MNTEDLPIVKFLTEDTFNKEIFCSNPFNQVFISIDCHIGILNFYFILFRHRMKKNNKTPADQQENFRPNGSSNDIFVASRVSFAL